MFDYHIHPSYSIDAEGTVEEFCRAALVVGLKEIAFTTHLDADRVGDDCYVNVKGKRVDIASSVWFEDYESRIRTTGDRYEEQGLRVLLGVEVDCFPGVQGALPERFFSTDFDFIIGSVHLIDHIAISANGRAEEVFRKYSMEELGERYFSILIDSIDLEIFDVLAHIDLYRRYGEVFYGESIHDLWKPHLKELSSKMLSKRVGFEINTSSLRRGMQQPMPEERIMRALRDEGISTVTVGSDAHTPFDVGKGINVALDMVKQAGFDGPSTYRKRKSTIIPWSDYEKQN
ncbi:MAG: histidinol-phosphatase HisJ family protein [Candidatus Thorarchaeota archaeon]|nr:histidinol-phosphatase HisJ family protein [Candidatus Thorarchaeota archaeon]